MLRAATICDRMASEAVFMLDLLSRIWSRNGLVFGPMIARNIHGKNDYINHYTIVTGLSFIEQVIISY